MSAFMYTTSSKMMPAMSSVAMQDKDVGFISKEGIKQLSKADEVVTGVALLPSPKQQSTTTAAHMRRRSITESLSSLMKFSFASSPREAAAGMDGDKPVLTDEQKAAVAFENEAKQVAETVPDGVLEAFSVTRDQLRAALVAHATRARALLRSGQLPSVADAATVSPPPLASVGVALKLSDEPFRKLVRCTARLPAFLGLALFQRAVEASCVVDAALLALQPSAGTMMEPSTVHGVAPLLVAPLSPAALGVPTLAAQKHDWKRWPSASAADFPVHADNPDVVAAAAMRQRALLSSITVLDWLRIWPTSLSDPSSSRADRFLPLLTPSPPPALVDAVLAARAASGSDNLPLSVASGTQQSLRGVTVPQSYFPLAWITGNARKDTITLTHIVRHQELMPCIESLVERHPDLVAFRASPQERAAYATYALLGLFAGMAPIGEMQVRLRDFLRSRVPDQFLACAATSEITAPPFCKAEFLDVQEAFEAALCSATHKHIGNITAAAMQRPVFPTITVDVLQASFDIDVPEILLYRVAAGVVRLHSGVPHHLCLADVIQLLLAISDRMSSSSLLYWQRCLDLDDDGRITLEDLRCLLLHRVQALPEGIASRLLSSAWAQTLDLYRPFTDTGITALQLQRTGLGPLLFELAVPDRAGGAPAAPAADQLAMRRLA